MSIRRREFNHVTTFRTRRRNAFSLSHPLGFVPSPWQMPEGRAGAEGRLLPTNTSRAHAIGKNMQRTSPGKIIVDGEASVGGGGERKKSERGTHKGDASSTRRGSEEVTAELVARFGEGWPGLARLGEVLKNTRQT